MKELEEILNVHIAFRWKKQMHDQIIQLFLQKVPEKHVKPQTDWAKGENAAIDAMRQSIGEKNDNA